MKKNAVKVNPLLEVNYQITGAVIDVPSLLARGWQELPDKDWVGKSVKGEDAEFFFELLLEGEDGDRRTVKRFLISKLDEKKMSLGPIRGEVSSDLVKEAYADIGPAVVSAPVEPNTDFEKMVENWGYNNLKAKAHIALWFGEMGLFTKVVDEIVKSAKQNGESEKEIVEFVYSAAVQYFNTVPGDAVACGLAVDAIEKLEPFVEKKEELRLLVQIVRAYLKNLKKEPWESWLNALAEMPPVFVEKFNAEHNDPEKPWLQRLPPGVSAPLAHQAYFLCSMGRFDTVLKTFPTPPLSTTEMFKYLPTREPVEGLSHYDVWSGFLPKKVENEAFGSYLADRCKELVPFGDEHKVENEDVAANYNRVKTLQMLAPQTPESEELTSLAVSAKSEENEKGSVLAIFPYLPKEHAANKANVNVKVWKYYPWANAEAADVKFTIGENDPICAAMPFYSFDRGCIVRGSEWKAKFAGFVSEFNVVQPKELPPPMKITEGYLAEQHGGPVDVQYSQELFDWFDQDTIDGHVSRSGFGMRGRIKSVRTLDAFGGKVYAVKIECARLEYLDEPLEVFVGADRVEKEPKAGDTVEVYGWLYLDIFESCHGPEEFFAKYPNGAPELDRGFFPGATIFVRLDFTEEEKKNGIADNDWVGYGVGALRGVKGVDKVVYCGENPEHVDFLVRKDGKVLPYCYRVLKQGDALPVVKPGVGLLVMRLERSGKGAKVTWEGLPGES